MTPLAAKNILMHELIGLDVKVVRDKNPNNTSIQGKVVDESRNTLVIQQGDRTKRVVKKNAVLMFKLPDRTAVEVEGFTLVGRPEDRAKKRTKRGW